MPLLTVDDAKAQLGITTLDHDVELGDYVAAAEVVVESFTHEIASQREVVEQFSVGRKPALVLSWTPVVSLTEVVSLDGATIWDVANLVAGKSTGVVRVLSGPLFCGDLQVTYQAGYTVVPKNHNLAGRIIVQHLWETQRGRMGGPRVGGMDDSMSNLAGGSRGYAIPNAALELLGESGPAFA